MASKVYQSPSIVYNLPLAGLGPQFPATRPLHGLSSPVREWCRGHFPPPHPTVVFLLLRPGWASPQAQLRPTAPPFKRNWGTSAGAGMLSYDLRERRPSMMPAIRDQDAVRASSPSSEPAGPGP